MRLHTISSAAACASSVMPSGRSSPSAARAVIVVPATTLSVRETIDTVAAMAFRTSVMRQIAVRPIATATAGYGEHGKGHE